jgi:hypothetical protein
MTLQDIFNWLKYGELAHLGLYDSATGEVTEENKPKIISHIILGLRDLHTKFPLKEREVAIQQYDYITKYYLKKEYAITNPNETPDGKPKYIVDSPLNPFTGDILRIDQVFDEYGTEMPINEPSNIFSVFTPAYNILQIPRAVKDNAVFVTYRADHAKIPLDVTDLAGTEIEIPDSHTQALLFFVAGRLFASMNHPEGSPLSAEYQMKYMNEVAQIIQQNLSLEYTSQTRLDIRREGWV